jgi:D-tyrosyl-tRNA(Tyr) deacylase
MRVLLQRVENAKVVVELKTVGEIGPGLLLFLGIGLDDFKEDIEWLCGKILSLRIFSDEKDLMNKSILDTRGEILLISQFTLFAQTKKGNRPGFTGAARPQFAIPLYESFRERLEKSLGKKIETGVFGADMKVHLVNDGPVTLFMDSRNKE